MGAPHVGIDWVYLGEDGDQLIDADPIEEISFALLP